MTIHYCANAKQPSIEVYCTKEIIFNQQSSFSSQENCYINTNGLKYTFEKDDVTCPECRKLIDQHTVKSAYNSWWPWIDINLPYLIRTNLPKPELTIDTDAIVLKKFGCTVNSLFDDYKSKHGYDVHSRQSELEQEFIKQHPEMSEYDVYDAAKNYDHPHMRERLIRSSLRKTRFTDSSKQFLRLSSLKKHITK